MEKQLQHSYNRKHRRGKNSSEYNQIQQLGNTRLFKLRIENKFIEEIFNAKTR